MVEVAPFAEDGADTADIGSVDGDASTPNGARGAGAGPGTVERGSVDHGAPASGAIDG